VNNEKIRRRIKMITEFFIKWGLGIITGILGSIGVFFRKEIKNFFKFKEKQKKDEMLADVNEEIENVEELVEAESNAFAKELKAFRKEVLDIIKPIQAAVLSSHYEALLARCKEYICRGYILFDELELLEKDYETYSDLGGNGHMDAWMTRVRILEIRK
jgi:ElaB/YqjD/DUF883 family membrane-anchored ribosome-binding protein